VSAVSDTVSEDQLVQYQVVAARRLQWDNLVWQVPILSLTAQAFLFTIALGADTQPVPRLTSAVLSLVVTVLSISLMARHRQAEEVDAAWLERFEAERFGPERTLHGLPFRERRDQVRVRVPGGSLGPLAQQFRAWLVGLAVFGLAALGVCVWSVATLVG
jgi:hypothetical protein